MEEDNQHNTEPLTLVTAIYNHGVDSLPGGRGRGIHFYNSTLKNIANLNLPLVVYTSLNNIDTVRYYLSSYFKKYIIVPFEIESFYFTERVLNYKERIFNTIELNDRNHILCYGKSFWVEDAIKKNIFNSDKFLWIDSGLFHHGIFPEKIGGVELFINPEESHYYPHNIYNIFTPTLGKKISDNIKPGRIFACGLPWQGSHDTSINIIKNTFNTDTPFIKSHIIGGIFGGYKEDYMQFHYRYNLLLDYCIDNNILTLEEPLFSCIYTCFPEMFNLHEFSTWWFYSPGERTHMLSEEGDSFYKIFLRL